MNIQIQKTATSELENFDLQKIQREFETHAPLLWDCASQAATSTHRKTFNSVKGCAALCGLVQGRSRILNSLQHAVAIAMYNNQLQKDDFSVLSNLVFSVSHTTVNAKLNIAKSQNEILMKTNQISSADSIECKNSVKIIETEHTYAAVDTER